MQAQARQQIEQARQEERQAILAQLQQQEQQQRAAYEQQLTSLVENFAKDKPNWPQIEDEVRYHILALKGTNPDMPPHEILTRAYDRALAQHPDKNPKAVAERKRKADEARKIASLNVGMRSAGGMTSSVGKSFEQTMRDVADRLMPG